MQAALAPQLFVELDAHSLISTHVLPSPEYPLLQAQVYDPVEKVLKAKKKLILMKAISKNHEKETSTKNKTCRKSCYKIIKS